MIAWHTPNESDPEGKDAEKAKRAQHLIAETGAIEQRQSSWHLLNLWNATLFSNRELPGFRWGETSADYELQPVDLRTENMYEEIGEAFMAKAASSPIKPTPVPRGQNLETESAVRTLDFFQFGVWQQTQSEEACIQMFLDAYIAGLGCVHSEFNEVTEELQVESVFFDNLVIDNRECPGRTPPRTYRIRRVLPKAGVEARYGVTLPTQRSQYVDYREVADGWVVVVTAWRLPDEAGNGGYYMKAAGDKILEEKVWKDSWVPLTFFHWTDEPSGFLRKSGVEQLVPFQNRQDELNAAIEKVIDIVSVPRLLGHAGSQLDVNTLDNEIGRMWLYSGIEPKPFEWRTNALIDLCNERVRNRQVAFTHMGISEQFTGADLAQGVRLDSSAGLREFHNMEDRRNLRRWSRYERARLEVAKTNLRVLGKAKKAKAYTAYYYPGRGNVVEVPFDAIKQIVDTDEYSWEMAATPVSAMSPAARRELIRDYTSRGIVKEGSDEARRMESNSNLEREETLELASKEDIDLRVMGILESGEYEAPDIITNTTYGIRRVAENIHRLRRLGIKEKDERIQNHFRWIVEAIAIQQSTVQEAQQQAGQMVSFQPTQGMPGTSSAVGAPV